MDGLYEINLQEKKYITENWKEKNLFAFPFRKENEWNQWNEWN